MQVPLLEEDDTDELRLEGGPWFEGYLVTLKRRHRSVLFFWSVMLLLGCIFGPQFASLGNDRMTPPRDSLAFLASQAFQDRFQDKATELPVILLLECIPQQNKEKQDELEVCDLRNQELKAFYEYIEDFVASFNRTANNVLSIMSWYKYNGTLLDGVKDGFMNAQHRDSIVTILVRSKNDTQIRHDFISALADKVDSLNPDPTRYEIGVTGFDAMNSVNIESAKSEIMRVDAFTVPIAVVILAYMIGSWRLLLLAATCMAVSVLTSFALMSFAILVLEVPRPEPTTAQLMEIICIALTIDYSLFLLRRYRDEIEKGASSSYAVYVMMYRAGHVVASSGTTLILVMLAYLLVPSVTIRMDGVSCAIGIAVCVIVNLSVTPAFLFAFPDFFSSSGSISTSCRARDKHSGASSARVSEAATLDTSPDADDLYATDNEAEQGIQPMYKTFRVKLTKRVTSFPCNLITVAVLYVLAVPFMLKIPSIQLDQNILHLMPRNSDATLRLNRMYEEFPGGTFAPFTVLINLPEDSSDVVLRPDTFQLAASLAQRIRAEANCSECVITSPATVGERDLSVVDAQGLLGLARSGVCNWSVIKLFFLELCKEAHSYAFLWGNSVNERENAMTINVVVPYFPFEKRGEEFVHKVNDLLAQEEKAHNQQSPDVPVRLYLTGFEVGPEAIKEAVFKVFPFMILVTVAAVFITLGVMLKSYFVTVRLALTLFLPLSSVFGLAVMVYQDGIFNWTGIDSISSTDGFFWSIPIMIITMIAGLVLDMDIFLITRIMEHRSTGYDIQAATVKAVAEVGPTITAAGCIMISCFCGLLLSQQTMIDQSGWLLSTSVLVDIFILNTLLVPALVSLGDKIAWHPTKMPMHNLITLDSPEFSETTESSLLAQRI